MEIIDESFFSALTSKIKKVFGNPNDETKSTPEQELYEEIISSLKNVLFETLSYLSKHQNKEITSKDTFDKMGIVAELIRNILQFIKQYKITTKNPKDTKFTRDLYTNVVEPLHKIQKDTPIIEMEKTLVSIAKHILKVADKEAPVEHGAVGDDMINAHNTFKNLFKSFPTSNYRDLKNVLDKKSSPNPNLRKEYIARARQEYEKTNKNSSKETMITQPEDEWNQERKPTQEDLFQDYLQDKLEADFDALWDSSFKEQWLEDYKKEVEQQRASLAHLKESVGKNIRNIFIKD